MGKLALMPFKREVIGGRMLTGTSPTILRRIVNFPLLRKTNCFLGDNLMDSFEFAQNWEFSKENEGKSLFSFCSLKKLSSFTEHHCIVLSYLGLDDFHQII